MRLQNTLGEEEIKKQKKVRVNGGLSVRVRGSQKRFTAKTVFRSRTTAPASNLAKHRSSHGVA
jgi:hypothetical protein